MTNTLIKSNEYNLLSDYMQDMQSDLTLPQSEINLLNKRVLEAENGSFISQNKILEWLSAWSKNKEINFPKPDIVR